MSASAPPARLELRLLGGFEAYLGSRAVTAIASPRMRALLAYLAMGGTRDHEREALAELFWGAAPPARARNYLRNCVWELRGILEKPFGGAVFATDKHSLRLLPDVYVDALAFAAPESTATPLADEERMALYRGEFLAGLTLPASPPFEDWLQMQREALHRRALALLEQLANRHAQAGNVPAALEFALRHGELEPWAEDAQRRVMRLHAMNGQPGAALAHYENCRRQLEQELGVLPSEETRSLAQDIRRGALPSAPPSLQSPPRLAPPLVAERRQVSVLYCDLAQAAPDDPDEAMELLHAPQARCVELIRQFAGHIVQVHGGGLLAYFGYPQAHEDAARRAVQAALAVARAGDGNEHGIEIRAGVHTGLIITGGDPAMPDSVGKTSRIAIQLRQCLPRGGVAISAETHGLVGGYFDCADIGALPAPDSLRTLQVFRVNGPSGAQSRLEAAARLTPLVGRLDELARLAGLWQDAADGQRRLLLLLRGEPGIGKSRLLLTLREHLAGTPHVIREMRCFPESAQSPFHPLIALIEDLCGFLPGDSTAARSAKLAASLDARFPTRMPTALPLLAALLSLPANTDEPPPTLSPRQQKEATHELLLDLLALETARQPVLLIVEDLHWLDPSTRELLDRFVSREDQGALLALFTARPEFDPPWAAHRVAPLHLAPLPDAEVAALVDALVADMPATARANIVRRADGIPLFAEEMTRIAHADPGARIPATLLDLLAARIDALGDARLAAQLAATLGREFDRPLLEKIFPQAPATLARHLDALREAGLLSGNTHGMLQFKHALIQEAAYQSQSKATRVAAHGRIARVLESEFADIVAQQPELLARHLGAAGECMPAIDHWVLAGKRAADHSAHQEAVSHFQAALALAATLPAGQRRDSTEFKLLIALGPVQNAAHGYGSLPAADINARIGELAARVGDGPDLFPAKWAMTIGTIGGVSSRGMPRMVADLQEAARGDPVRQIAAHNLGVNSSFWLGDWAACLHHDERTMALCRPGVHGELIEQFGSDLTVFSAGYAAFALWMSGRPAQALARAEWALEQARSSAHPHTLAQALCFLAIVERWNGGSGRALVLATEAGDIAVRHEMPLWIASASGTRGWARAMEGGVEEGLTEIRRAIAIASDALRGILVIYIATLADAAVRLGRHEEALDAVGQAQAAAAASHDAHYTAELLRLKGEALLGLSTANTEAAEECFHQALAASRAQQALSLELRAATSMAQLWQGQGQSSAAHALLAEVYGRFSEGFDSHDLRLAAELMRQA